MLLSYHGPEATPVWWKLSRNSKQDEINNRRIRILAVITATKQSKPWMKSNLANVGECIHQGDTQCMESNAGSVSSRTTKPDTAEQTMNAPTQRSASRPRPRQ